MRQLCSSYRLKLSIFDTGKCVTGWGSFATGVPPVLRHGQDLSRCFGRGGHGTSVAVGAAIKFHSVKFVPSPRWASKEGLEWLWRLGSPSPGYLENPETW
jgi:hypothetical protein